MWPFKKKAGEPLPSGKFDLFSYEVLADDGDDCFIFTITANDGRSFRVLNWKMFDSRTGHRLLPGHVDFEAVDGFTNLVDIDLELKGWYR